MRHPSKVRKLTAKQEEELTQAKRFMAKSAILQYGVCESLKLGFQGEQDLQASLEMLEESIRLRTKAREIRVREKI